MAVFTSFGAIVVTSVSRSSGIFFGENVQAGWDSHSKTNDGFSITGNALPVIAPLVIINDPDVIDSPINDQDIEGSVGPSILKGV
ncbi:MAG: hypothetical protein QHH75_11180 [Bacillota bacterium]|jgi:hypothetical protein|nr:hypothetical protein [Bacillota bacterium]